MWFLYECERTCYEYLDLLWKYLATILLSSVCYYYVIKKLITSDKLTTLTDVQYCHNSDFCNFIARQHRHVCKVGNVTIHEEWCFNNRFVHLLGLIVKFSCQWHVSITKQLLEASNIVRTFLFFVQVYFSHLAT